jgi:hypothetical protein
MGKKRRGREEKIVWASGGGEKIQMLGEVNHWKRKRLQQSQFESGI